MSSMRLKMLVFLPSVDSPISTVPRTDSTGITTWKITSLSMAAISSRMSTSAPVPRSVRGYGGECAHATVSNRTLATQHAG